MEKIKAIARACDIPSRLSELNIPVEAIEDMTKSANTITQSSNNNLKSVSLEDAKQIYLNTY